MFRVFSHDHDGYNITSPKFDTFEAAYAYARDCMETHELRWGKDFRYWQDALIKENDKSFAIIYPK